MSLTKKSKAFENSDFTDEDESNSADEDDDHNNHQSRRRRAGTAIGGYLEISPENNNHIKCTACKFDAKTDSKKYWKSVRELRQSAKSILTGVVILRVETLPGPCFS
jgi:hypothetical protein